MRGERVRPCWCGWPGRRFIPACAGNAQVKVFMAALPAVHPRMRGEREIRCRCHAEPIGSSPHARGTRCTPGAGGHAGWFIPACAGNACQCRPPGCRLPVHPRMRGERGRTYRYMRLNAGSSPHARGTRRSRCSREPVDRFIPACAGNALLAARTLLKTSVHPRMRGERTNP